MVAHAVELLTAGSNEAEIVLHEEHYNLGGISMEELHRLVYAQVLSSHPLTWQVSIYFLEGECICPINLDLFGQPCLFEHCHNILYNAEIPRVNNSLS